MAHGALEAALVADSLGDCRAAMAAQHVPVAAPGLAAWHVGTDAHVRHASSHDANTCGNFATHARLGCPDSLTIAEYYKTLLPKMRVCFQPPNSPNLNLLDCFLWGRVDDILLQKNPTQVGGELTAVTHVPSRGDGRAALVR